jgi:hypothetical protein
MKSIQTSYNALQTDLLTLDQIGIDIIQCFLDRLMCLSNSVHKTLNDGCIDFLQCFSKYVYKTLNDVCIDFIECLSKSVYKTLNEDLLRHWMKSIQTSMSVL